MKSLSYIGVLFLLIGIQSCSEMEDPAENVELNNVLGLSLVNHLSLADLDSNSILADSVSSIIVKAVLGEESASGQVITFTTSHGYLTLPGETNNKVNVQSLSVTPGFREAFVVLHSGNKVQDNVLVAAKVGNFTNVKSVQFNASYPEVINVSPSASVVDSIDTVSFIVEGFRNVGMISNEILYAIKVKSDSLVINTPQFGVLEDGKGSFIAMNESVKKGRIEFEVKVPVNETDSLSYLIPIEYE